MCIYCKKVITKIVLTVLCKRPFFAWYAKLEIPNENVIT